MREHDLIQSGERVLVAVSGGVDSVVLLRILTDASQLLGVTVHTAHLNHRLRGPESDADEEFVRGLAAELGVPLEVESIDMKQAAGKQNIEEAAREARLEFLKRTSVRVRAGKTALGHTADDQVETFLLNLLRGAGLDGLTGMPHMSPDGVIRPLLDVWRSEIADHAAQEGMGHREDSSNLDTELVRNRIRHRLLPALAAEYNPKVRARILRTMSLLTADADVLEAVARRAFARVAAQVDEGLLLDVAELSRLEVGVARRVTRIALEEVLGTLHDMESVHVETLLVRVARKACGRLQVPGHELEVKRRGSDVVISRYAEPPQACEFEYELTVPGVTVVPEAEVAITGLVCGRPEDVPTDGERMQAAIDLNKVEGSLVVRSRRSGDRIAPLGMGGHTKLVSDVLTDRKVPPQERARLCVVCDSHKVIWLPGQMFSELVRITQQTRETLVLRIACWDGEQA